MSNDPDQIRADIESTRRELGSDVDALADKVNPSKVAERQADKVKGVFRAAKDRVMGTADDLRGDAAHATGEATDAVKTAVAKAQGSPFAIGLIAFGVGLLAASLVPASSKERELAGNVTDAAQPIVKDAAREAAGNLKQPAQEAAAAVKDSATDAYQHVAAEASDAAGDVKQQAQQSKETVQNQVPGTQY